MVFRNVALLLDGKLEPAKCACHMLLPYLLVGNIVKKVLSVCCKGVFSKL